MTVLTMAEMKAVLMAPMMAKQKAVTMAMNWDDCLVDQ